MRCKDCHYSLRNLTTSGHGGGTGGEGGHRCPECGLAFDPNDASTFEPGWRRSQYDPSVVLFLYLGNFVVCWLTTFFILPSSPGSGKDHFINSVWTSSLWTVVVAPILMNVYFVVGRWRERVAYRDQA